MTAAAGSIVLFGGAGFGGLAGDSWRFDGIHWTQVQDIGPVPRFSHAVTFDSTRSAVVLFGGIKVVDANEAVLGDTWEHNTFRQSGLCAGNLAAWPATIDETARLSSVSQLSDR
jgi:hypothetical protein